MNIGIGDIIYRTFRLRRLFATCMGFCLLGLGLSIAIGGSDSFFASPIMFIVALAVWAAVILLHNVIFPIGWLEALAMSIALVPFLAATSFIEFLMTLAKENNIGLAVIFLVCVIGFGWFFLMLGLVFISGTGFWQVQLGNKRQHGSFSTRVPVQNVADLLFLRPDMDTALHKSGPQDETGFFMVSFMLVVPDLTDLVPREIAMEYKAKIIEQDGLSQKTQTVVIPDGGTFSNSVIEERCFENDGITIYEYNEVHDHFNRLNSIGFWIQDMSADYIRASLDTCEGRRSPAIRFLPRITIMSELARIIIAQKANNPPL